MSDRLIRALQRGGCTARDDAKSWSVWRSRDRRGRKIGRLQDEQVQALRMQGALKPLGSGSEISLVWTGQALPVATAGKHSAGIGQLMSLPDTGPQPLLLRVLKKIRSDDQRQKLVNSVLHYREDWSASVDYARPAGMNWTALLAGQKIDTSANFSTASTWRFEVASCKRRIDAIYERLGEKAAKLLTLMIIDGQTRGTISRSLAISNKAAELLALRALRSLSDFYIHSIKV